MANAEEVRKVVGREREKRPLQRMWERRKRLLKLGIDVENKDEWIRKTVGRTKNDGRRLSNDD